MPSTADIHTRAPANTPTVNKLPAEKITDAYVVGVGAAYGWAGMSLSRPSASDAPTIHDSDGTLQVTQTRLNWSGEIHTGFHASDPERLHIVEGIVVVSDLGRIARTLFQASSDGGETHEEFLFSRRAWVNLVDLMADHGDEFQREPMVHLLPQA